MPKLQLPAEVESAIKEIYTAEVTTVNRQGQPMTWPSVCYYNEQEGHFVVAVSIAFPVKAYNARRHPQMSLLFSEPTGSGLEDPPAVLVQGDAVKVEEVLEYGPDIIGLFKLVSKRQPDSKQFTGNKVIRNLFVWYLFQRISITIEPRRILYWSHRDFSADPQEIYLGVDAVR